MTSVLEHCSLCNILIPSCKLPRHQTSRICEFQKKSQYISWKNIYVECPCGIFICQKNIAQHLQTIRHREYIQLHSIQIYNHPFFKLQQQFIHGGSIIMVNERMQTTFQNGRLFMKRLNERHISIPSFFMKFIGELIQNSSIQISCTICYDNIDAETIYILPCFHIICSECEYKLSIKKCPICRSIY